MTRQCISTLNTSMTKENVSRNFRLKNINESRNYLLDDIKHNELMCEKHKKVRRTLNYFEHFLFLFLLSVIMFQFLHLLH